MSKANEVDEVVAVKGMWVKEGDMVEIKVKGQAERVVVKANSDPYYDNEDGCDVINTNGCSGYAKWNASNSYWEC